METRATPRQCAERVYNDPRWISGNPCQHPAKVKEDNKWWCGTHSKAARAKRRAKQDALYEENRELDQRRVDRAHELKRHASHYDALIEALDRLLSSIKLSGGTLGERWYTMDEDARLNAIETLHAARLSGTSESEG